MNSTEYDSANEYVRERHWGGGRGGGGGNRGRKRGSGGKSEIVAK